MMATFVPLLGLVVVLWRRRWLLLLMLWLSSIVASFATSFLTDSLGERDVTTTLDERTSSGSSLVAADFPTTEYLAFAVAATVVGAAHLPRRWKHALWSWVTVLMVLRLLGPGQPPLDIWIAVSLGVVVGSLTLLVFGSPNLEPSPEQVLVALRKVGLDPIRIRRRDKEASGASYETDERDGTQTFVKLRTPDDRNWDLLTRLSRAIRLRSSEVGRPYSTLKRRVEHEALATRTVGDNNTRSPRVIAVGVTDGGASFLVQDLVSGRELSGLGVDEFDDDLLRSAFQTVRSVHATRTAHHSLTLDNMLIDSDGRGVARRLRRCRVGCRRPGTSA